MQQTTPIPTPAETSEYDDSKLDAILDECTIKPSHNYDEPEEILWVNEACIATLGNFSVSTGKAKSRKTFNVSAIVAAALCNGKVLGYRAKLPENKRFILYLDTEQGKHHCHKVQSRILTMADLPPEEDLPNLEFVALRGKDPSLLRKLTERAIARRKDRLGLVIIDGIRDLMLDINSSEDSVMLVNDLMRWSSEYNVHIHVALHLNKSDDNVRGHIGTEVNNKAETVLLVSKDRFDKSMSEVSPLYLRDKEFKPFLFMIDDNGIPQDVYGYKRPNETDQSAHSFSDLTELQHQEALDKAFNHGIIKGKSKAALSLMDAYASIDFKRGETTFNKILEHLVKKGIVLREGKNSFCLRKDFPPLPSNSENEGQ